MANFYRDPFRVIQKGRNVVAPADGRIISIITTDEDEQIIRKGFLGSVHALSRDVGRECHVISIFMSPLDVHINRAPISGTVRLIRHSRGKFFKAYDLKNSLRNEKNEILIENKELKAKVIQIAGFLARRIKCNVAVDEKINKGDKIGMIALGSQTTLIIPKRLKLRAGLNERVRAGETILAEMG